MQESAADLAHLMVGTGAVLLQREVPEHVNEAVAAAAAAAGVPILLVRPGCARQSCCCVWLKAHYLQAIGS